MSVMVVLHQDPAIVGRVQGVATEQAETAAVAAVVAAAA